MVQAGTLETPRLRLRPIACPYGTIPAAALTSSMLTSSSCSEVQSTCCCIWPSDCSSSGRPCAPASPAEQQTCSSELRSSAAQLNFGASSLPIQTSLQHGNCQPASTAAGCLAAPQSGPSNKPASGCSTQVRQPASLSCGTQVPSQQAHPADLLSARDLPALSTLGCSTQDAPPAGPPEGSLGSPGVWASHSSSDQGCCCRRLLLGPRASSSAHLSGHLLGWLSWGFNAPDSVA